MHTTTQTSPACGFIDCKSDVVTSVEVELPNGTPLTLNVCEMHWTQIFIAEEPNWLINEIESGNVNV